jgi:hypothetical protein
MNPTIWSSRSLALVVLVFASSAMAQSRTHMLKGDFAFTATLVCLNSPAIITPTSYTPPAGFTADLRPIGVSNVSSFSAQGVRTFNGDGTGSSRARSVFLTPGAAGATESSHQFTYSVAADRTLTIDEGPLHAVAVAGPGVGRQTRVTNTPTLVGRVSADGKSLTIASFNPGVETSTRLVPAPELVDMVRICQRAANAIRISRTPEADGLGED